MLLPAIASIPVHRTYGSDAASLVTKHAPRAQQCSGLMLRVSVKGKQLGGRVYGHRGKRKLADGTQIVTTEIVETTEQGDALLVLTQSGSRYVIGSWASEKARDGFLQLEAALIEQQAELVVKRIAARRKFLHRPPGE